MKRQSGWIPKDFRPVHPSILIILILTGSHLSPRALRPDHAGNNPLHQMELLSFVVDRLDLRADNAVLHPEPREAAETFWKS